MRTVVPALLFLATLCFGLGIVLPLLQVDRLYVFIDEPSLAGIVASLWTGGDRALAAVVALFSIVFPAAKLALLNVWAYAGREAHDRIPEWFRALSNWSMLDVVLVALVIFAAKTSGFATAFTRPGLWFFTASVLLTVAASYVLKRQKLLDQSQ
ncbi:paraquat-inducible protein A [Arvimicrobium flavum]|uniref:paraquat-inducible protein A n=1 Tax=Arvimicrobium flavum TaxID=3393320 RepID=UPI00237BF52E|nr:paraquat-inducible protein A [Mesorhizobium shangrilense]